MDKFRIINQKMRPYVNYTQEQLSQLVGFNLTKNSIKALITRGLIREKKGGYETNQADLFITTKTASTLCGRDNADQRQESAQQGA